MCTALEYWAAASQCLTQHPVQATEDPTPPSVLWVHCLPVSPQNLQTQQQEANAPTWSAQVYASDDKQEVDLAHIVGKCSVLPAGSELPGALAVEQAWSNGLCGRSGMVF